MNHDEHTPIRQRHKAKTLGFYDGAARRPASRDEALVIRTAAEVSAYGGVQSGRSGGTHWTTDAPETIRDIIAAVDAEWGKGKEVKDARNTVLLAAMNWWDARRRDDRREMARVEDSLGTAVMSLLYVLGQDDPR